MIAVVDYGVNNLGSVVRAVEAGGHRATLVSDPNRVRRADRVLVPGVGHFGQASRTLAETGLGDAVKEVARAGRPVMGICLGLQLFFENSEEAPEANGLGLLCGRVLRFSSDLPVPHVGWARVELTEFGRQHAMLWPVLGQWPQFYYHVHSYYPAGLPEGNILGTGEYGRPFPTIVGEGPVIGAQFHPEKSQRAGLMLLAAFAEWRP
ncbi:MAG TPA: imidazole glycerol phosphate synthase subunit HisH [Gemmatimonadales bacterium]|nr:imidazole glycerol phosphate synthase subunit HisH [Gemmatimonadales bacterium]